MKNLCLVFISLTLLNGCASLLTPSLAESRGGIKVTDEVALSGRFEVSFPKVFHFSAKEIESMLPASEKGSEPKPVSTKSAGDVECRAGMCEVFPAMKPGLTLYRSEIKIMSRLLGQSKKTGKKYTEKAGPLTYWCHREVCVADFAARFTVDKNADPTREMEVFEFLMKAYQELMRLGA